MMNLEFLLYVHMLYLFYRYSAMKNNPPRCRTCKYFKFNLNGIEFSRCTRFAQLIKDTNIVKYDYADLCRLDEDKCGPNAKFWESKKQYDMLDIITDVHYDNNKTTN